MHIKIQKWGNSLALRIPRGFAQEARISKGTTVDLGIKKDHLVLRPLNNKLTLSHLLMKVTKSNIHHEEDFGKAQGLENG